MVNMPDAVFNLWFRDLLEKDGSKESWPFVRASQRTFSTRWHQCLNGHSIQAIRNMRWQKRQIPATLSVFTVAFQNRLRRIIEAYAHKLCAPCTNVMDKKRHGSFWRALDHAERVGCLHAPAVLIQQAEGYQIMDGCHRIAALLSLPDRQDLLLDCWVGTVG